MDNKGITLTELLVAATIGVLIIFSITCLFVAQEIFRSLIYDQITVINDASVAMHYVTRILRFSDPASMNNPLNWIVGPLLVQINCYPEGLHLPSDPYNSTISFYWVPETQILQYNKSYYDFERAEWSITSGVIADDITSFNPVWDSYNQTVTLNITASKRGRSCSLETRIKLLPQIGNRAGP